MIKRLLVTVLVILSYFQSLSQQTAVFTNDLAEYNKAIELYTNNQFLASQALFSRLKERTTDVTVQGDCAYYIANCAVRLNQQDADVLMESFVKEYPTSTKKNEAFINVANYYFENGKFSYARKWYDKVEESSLSGVALERFNFNNAYAYFKNKRYEEAM